MAKNVTEKLNKDQIKEILQVMIISRKRWITFKIDGRPAVAHLRNMETGEIAVFMK